MKQVTAYQVESGELYETEESALHHEAGNWLIENKIAADIDTADELLKRFVQADSLEPLTKYCLSIPKQKKQKEDK